MLYVIKRYGLENPYAFGGDAYNKLIKEKYGVDNVFQSEIIKEKIKKTNLERYNVEYAAQSDLVKNKLRDAYNKKSPQEKFEILEKQRKSFNERYGTDWGLQSEEIKEKIKETNLKKYGAENPLSKGTKPYFKRNETVKSKYKVDNVFQDANIKDKCKQTFLKRYGVEHALQYVDFFKKAKAHYVYMGDYFDSSWELAYYIYNFDIGKNIIHEPCSFNYEYNNITYKYYPDFLIDGQYQEIKGDHFFENGVLICPFDRSLDGKMLEKYKCMIEHGVIILKYNDVKEAIQYVNTTYGRDYLMSFRRTLDE